jgi:hypothetical protein
MFFFLLPVLKTYETFFVLRGGFEPPLTAPKAAVLPLDDPRIIIIKNY